MTKFISIATTLFFLSFNLSFAQKQNLDALIQNINNKLGDLFPKIASGIYIAVKKND